MDNRKIAEALTGLAEELTGGREASARKAALVPGETLDLSQPQGVDRGPQETIPICLIYA